MNEENKEFSVYWWSVDGDQFEDTRYENAETCIRRARALTRDSVAAKMGIVARVMITDGGDFCNFEWIKGKGVVYPPKETVTSKE